MAWPSDTPNDTRNDTPNALLRALATSEPTRPRLTWYDDRPGPTQGERIELSGHVLANWVAKAANLLQEELEVGPGSVVALDLPAHWRAAYWLFAAWSVGAQVVVGPVEESLAADVLVSDAPHGWERRPGQAVVGVSRAALARAWDPEPAPLPPGAVDEARELATYGDRFDAWARPDGDAVALSTGAGRWTFAGLVPAARAAAGDAGLARGARVLTKTHPREVVTAWLPAWVADGSLVLVGEDPSGDDGKAAGDDAASQRRASAERVTDRL